ncbi:unnamed protein product, partial [Choristocarpus tenellus]
FRTRFTDAGDAVLALSADRDSELSRVVLKAGRTLIALVSELSRLQAFTDDLASVCDHVTKTGLWSKILTADQAQKMMGWCLRLANIPETNVPRTVLDDMASRQEGSDGSPARQVAQKAAASKGLEIKESDTHGVGLCAVKDIKAGDFIDISCFGTFVVYDTEKEVHDAIVADGVPRYMVTNDMASMCVGGEVSRPHAVLFFCATTLPLFVVHELMRGGLGEGEC